MVRAEKNGLRQKLIFCAGGPRVTHPLALECGFDAGFGVGTKPSDVASYIVEEWLKRNKPEALQELGIELEPSKSAAPVKTKTTPARVDVAKPKKVKLKKVKVNKVNKVKVKITKKRAGKSSRGSKQVGRSA
jgi:hypothetical protein